MFEPFENVEMRSMIEDAYPEESFAHPKFSVPTVIPGRTFLEKVFLLHEEFNRPGGCTRLDRLTRHMYDIEKMMDRDFAKEAMNDSGMYEEIVKHRQSLTAWSGLDYKLQNHQPLISYQMKQQEKNWKRTIRRCRKVSFMVNHYPTRN